MTKWSPCVNNSLNPQIQPVIVASGVIAVDTVPNKESKTYAQFVAGFKKVTGQAPERNPYAAMVYDEMILLALASEAAQSTEPKAIAAEMRAVSGPPGVMVFSFEEGLKALK